MKFNCDYFRDRGRRKRAAEWEVVSSWQPCFALWPIRLGKSDCRWLEMVERRSKYTTPFFQEKYINGGDTFILYEYRAKP